MSSSVINLSLFYLAAVAMLTAPTHGLAQPFLLNKQAANAVYVMDEETGDYVPLGEEADWQTTWKQRLDKAQTMTPDEVFAAARGAGNVVDKDNESESSKKRRAMSGCREAGLRQKANVPDVKECSARVLGGDVSFMLDVM
jgi:hypothetical protein